MKLKYDMHSHILPGVDDGARKVEDSLVLINRLKRAGVTDICLTPHYYTHRESLSDFLKRRDEAFEKLMPYVTDDINLHLGAEVYVTKYLFSNEEDLKSVCYKGTNKMLVEFPYSSTFKDEALRSINLLINNHGISPVLTHVERYPNLLKNLDVLEDLIYMGVTIQSNACSFSEFPLKFKVLKLLKNGYIQIIGSDAHSLNRNSPDAYNTFNEYLTKKGLESAIKEINSASADVLRESLH